MKLKENWEKNCSFIYRINDLRMLFGFYICDWSLWNDFGYSQGNQNESQELPVNLKWDELLIFLKREEKQML